CSLVVSLFLRALLLQRTLVVHAIFANTFNGLRVRTRSPRRRRACTFLVFSLLFTSDCCNAHKIGNAGGRACDEKNGKLQDRCAPRVPVEARPRGAHRREREISNNLQAGASLGRALAHRGRRRVPAEWTGAVTDGSVIAANSFRCHSTPERRKAQVS